ncbi:hypothetical protein [Nocardia sp. IFM 10818]
MKLSKFAATSALVISALGIATGTSYAQPAPAPSPLIPSIIDGVNQGINQLVPQIHWNAQREGDSVVVTTDAGSLTTADNQFQVRDNLGNLVTAVPTSFTIDNIEYPIDVAVDGLRATLTPRKDQGHEVAASVDPLRHNVVRQDAFDDAMSAAGTQFGLATAIGTLVGTVLGLGLGCGLGFIALVPTTPIFLPGPIGGCLAGAAAGAALGGAAGMVIVGGVAAVVVAIGFFTRINAPENQ